MVFWNCSGGVYKELRKRSAEILSNINFDGYAIGGLSVGETHKEMIDVIKSTVKYLDIEKPNVMGIGRQLTLLVL